MTVANDSCTFRLLAKQVWYLCRSAIGVSQNMVRTQPSCAEACVQSSIFIFRLLTSFARVKEKKILLLLLINSNMAYEVNPLSSIILSFSNLVPGPISSLFVSKIPIQILRLLPSFLRCAVHENFHMHVHIMFRRFRNALLFFIKSTS